MDSTLDLMTAAAGARPAWLPTEGTCACLIGRRDWSASPLGPIAGWPAPLRTMLGVALRSSTPMAVLWGERGLAFYNDGFAALLGSRHPEALGLSSLDAFTTFRAFNRHVLRTCLDGGTLVLRNREIRLDRGRGTERAWFDLDCVPVAGEDGRPAGVLVTAIETTACVTAERDVHEGEARLRALADNLPGAVVYQAETARDLSDRRFTYASGSVGPLLGLSSEEVLADPMCWLSRVDPADVPFILEAAQAAARDLSTLDFEVRVRGASRRMIRGRVVARPRESGNGRLLWDGMLLDMTAMREAEAELRRTGSLLQAIGAATPDLVYAKDREGRLLYVNPALATVLGQPAASLIGSSETDWSRDPAEAAAIRSNDQRIMDQGKPVEFEEVFTGADGVTRVYRTVKSPLRDETGAAVGLVGLSGDITGAKRAGEDLRRLNAALEERVAQALVERKIWADVFETTDAFVAVVGPDLRLLAVNRACAAEIERLGGRKPQVGDHVPDLYHTMPKVAAAAQALWTRALEGEAFTITEEFGDPVRHRPCYEMKFGPLRARDGSLVGAYQFATDATERLRAQHRVAQAEAARREADALYRAYFQNSAEGLFVVRVQPGGGFSVEEVNPTHERTLGLDPATLRGRPLEEQLPPDVAVAVAENYRRAVETGQIQRYRESVHMGGGLRHYDTVLVPVRDESGRIARLVGSSRDMTAQVQAEEALRQSQKLDSMGQLTGGVAHDFNNLLTPILASLDMLHQRGVGDARIARLVEGALQSAERARTLVQRLLAFARRQPLRPAPVSLGDLVAGMADLVATTVGPRIQLETEVDPALPSVLADANQIEMAVLNLVVNARDAMPDGGRLKITARLGRGAEGPVSLPHEGVFARMSVADTGTGMDAATLARAVEPFFSTKGIGRGTGLGLSMVHGLASQLGGALEICSRPGEGTTVDLWLPLAEEIAERASEPCDAAGSSVAGLVLLVDDEEIVRTSTAHMLGELGYSVMEAGTAEMALRLVENGLRPDLLVTDHLMPGQTGTALASRLRAMVPALPVLVVSGYAEDGGIAPDLPRLAKPFRKTELAAALATLAGTAAPS